MQSNDGVSPADESELRRRIVGRNRLAQHFVGINHDVADEMDSLGRNSLGAQIVSGVQRASGPAIALDTTKIAVQTNLTSSTTGTTIGVACAGGFRTTSTDAAKPCTGSYDLATSTSNSIKVESQYQSSFLVPLPIPVSAPMLRATAVYKCEFT